MHIPLVRRASIHAIHFVFPQPGITGHTDGKEPISDKKNDKGDGNYTSTKEMIGFVFDGIKRTIHLPKLKAAKYIREIHHVLRINDCHQTPPDASGSAPARLNHLTGGPRLLCSH